MTRPKLTCQRYPEVGGDVFGVEDDDDPGGAIAVYAVDDMPLCHVLRLMGETGDLLARRHWRRKGRSDPPKFFIPLVSSEHLPPGQIAEWHDLGHTILILAAEGHDPAETIAAVQEESAVALGEMWERSRRRSPAH